MANARSGADRPLVSPFVRLDAVVTMVDAEEFDEAWRRDLAST
jgi:G3E family GTPase